MRLNAMSTAAQTSAAHCAVYSRLSCRWTVLLKSNQCYTYQTTWWMYHCTQHYCCTTAA